MLKQIHEFHLDINECKQRARELLFMPEISPKIEKQVAKCDVWAAYLTEYVRDTMTLSENPYRPSKPTTDLFESSGFQYPLPEGYYS